MQMQILWWDSNERYYILVRLFAEFPADRAAIIQVSSKNNESNQSVVIIFGGLFKKLDYLADKGERTRGGGGGEGREGVVEGIPRREDKGWVGDEQVRI